jgi:sulfur-oxidizing protein SoxZ
LRRLTLKHGTFHISFQEQVMAEPMRIRAQSKDGKANVRVLMSHEMETGLRKDSAGQLVPVWHITEVSAEFNGKVVMTAEWGTAVAKNPFLQFFVKGAKPGDKITITWKDNKGDARRDEATVT